MESFSFRFERMSNLDVHPLSLPLSRLSPAKSSGSIVDHLAHHQHGKGDSAYSSFSGGSNAPDYPSPFLQDDLQSTSYNHYTDLKYVRAIYQPNQGLQSDSKTMDQFYRSVEAISQQYRNNNVNGQHQSGFERCRADSKKLCLQEASQHPPPPLNPPLPPARLDSFVATRNLENSRGHHQDTRIQAKQPPTEMQQMPFINLYPQTMPQDTVKPQKANPELSSSGLGSDLVYGVWRGPQQEPLHSQSLPSCRPLQQHDQMSQALKPEHILSAHSKGEQQQQSTYILSKSPPRRTNQTESQGNKRLTWTGGVNAKKGNGHFDGHRKRAHSAKDSLGPEPNRASSAWDISSNIQHKGHFYFVTGTCKQKVSGVRKHSAPSCASEAGSESSTVVETYRLREKDRCHSTMEHFFRPPQHRPYTSNEAISDKVQVYTAMSQEQDSIFNNQDENQSALSNRPSPMTKQPRHSFDSLEQIDLNHSQERHTSNHPIFFCGLEGNVPPQAKGTTKEPTSVTSNEQLVLHKREEPLKKSRRQPLGDVASERINKETTPLLYHLTGASRAALKPKKNGIGSVKGEEAILNKTGQKDDIVHGNERSLQSEPVEEDRGEVFSNVCNALDDSFQKYYKERLKVAQPKVLSETSFTRKDLQLSWPHRIKEHPQLRPTVMHCFSAKQDSETSLETLTPSVTSEGTEVGSLKKEATEMEKGQEGKREHGRPVNVAQPQVARIGGRRRLTAEQKMCYSEPEKLHQLGDSPNHSYCHSLGNEDEHFFSAERHGEEPGQHGERGLVAARRKMFETRGRASSASSLSKTNLKNLQHKALVDYMERKTGQKVAEPQQPGPQLPPAPRQRHSIGEKPVEWGAKSPAASTGGQGFKKQLNRPHSAGRILDSSSSSIRYAQFSLAQSASVRCIGKPGWKEGQAAHGKAASVESLLNHIQTEDFVRNRSISSPQTFQELGPDNESSPASTMETQSRKQRNPEDVSVTRPALEDVSVARPAPEDVSMARPALEDVSVTRPAPEDVSVARPAPEDVSVARPAPDVEQRVRVVAQRGKSMEELGAFFKCTRALVLSRSSEQLDQSWSHPARPERKKSSPSSVFGREHDEMANARGQGLEMSGLEKAQALGQKPTQKISLSKAHLTAQLGLDEEAWPPVNAGTNDSSRPPSPASTNSSRDRSSSGTPGSHGSVTEEARPSSESSNQQPPNGQEIREMKSSSSSSLVNQTRFPKESEPCSKDRKSPTVTSSEQSSDDPTGVPPRPDSNQEVSTPSTPSPDISDEHAGSPLPDNVFEDNSTGLESPAQSGERLKSPSNGVAVGDGSHFAEREETAEETANVDPAEGQEVAERGGTPEARTESSEEADEKPRWAELAAAVVQADGSLARAIYPLANRKTALMLMEQLLSEDTLLMEEHYKKKQEQVGVARSAAVEPPPASDSHTEQRADPQSQAEITEKKRLLLSHVEERLRALEETRGVLREEIQENEVRGQAVLALVRERCLPVELERYGLFIGDLERVVSLLLCLSARLARVQNALSTVDQHTDAEEKQSLDSRHRLLCKQREDAKDLKDNLDRREGLVSAFLSRQLSAEQLAAYRRFVQTTASLLIRQKDLDERQQLGEEQMLALRCSLPPPPS